jgi:predicted dehydrogenase
MARVRGQALLATGRTEIVAVASRNIEHARAIASELGAADAFDDFRCLEVCRPEAVLVETPHQTHDEVVPWALETGFDLLIGGNLASSVAAGERFADQARRQERVVECGYDRRYHPAWEKARELIQAGDLGRPIQAYAAGLWSADPQSWYYSQAASGGMPLTHMSYVGLSYIRWIFGQPVGAAAAANRVVQTAPGLVEEESCAAIVHFESGAFATVIASYYAPAGWPWVMASFVCSRGGAIPDEGEGTLTIYRGAQPEALRFPKEPSSCVRQANAFLDAVDQRGGQRNPPEDALWDVRLAEAIAKAAREHIYVSL